MEDGRLKDAVLATQADMHALFGGVVPELASREHYRFCGALYDELMRRTGLTIDDIDVIAVSRGPGLLGSLLVGVAFAKGLALGSGGAKGMAGGGKSRGAWVRGLGWGVWQRSSSARWRRWWG